MEGLTAGLHEMRSGAPAAGSSRVAVAAPDCVVETAVVGVDAAGGKVAKAIVCQCVEVHAVRGGAVAARGADLEEGCDGASGAAVVGLRRIDGAAGGWHAPFAVATDPGVAAPVVGDDDEVSSEVNAAQTAAALFASEWSVETEGRVRVGETGADDAGEGVVVGQLMLTESVLGSLVPCWNGCLLALTAGRIDD